MMYYQPLSSHTYFLARPLDRLLLVNIAKETRRCGRPYSFMRDVETRHELRSLRHKRRADTSPVLDLLH
jgi:hypothetical protein